MEISFAGMDMIQSQSQFVLLEGNENGAQLSRYLKRCFQNANTTVAFSSAEDLDINHFVVSNHIRCVCLDLAAAFAMASYSNKFVIIHDESELQLSLSQGGADSYMGICNSKKVYCSSGELRKNIQFYFAKEMDVLLPLPLDRTVSFRKGSSRIVSIGLKDLPGDFEGIPTISLECSEGFENPSNEHLYARLQRVLENHEAIAIIISTDGLLKIAPFSLGNLVSLGYPIFIIGELPNVASYALFSSHCSFRSLDEALRKLEYVVRHEQFRTALVNVQQTWIAPLPLELWLRQFEVSK